jgi:hypothetical protein
MAVSAMIVGGTLVSLAPPASALGTNDADLVVSFEEPGVQEASFSDNANVVTETFGQAAAGASNRDDSDFSSDLGYFSAGFSRLTGDEKAGTADTVDGSAARERMLVVWDDGDDDNRAGFLDIDSNSSDLKYLGFWWGSGNTGSGDNVIRFYREGVLVADFDAGDIDDNLAAADGDFVIADYMGNPNYCWPGNYDPPGSASVPPAAVRCGDTDTRPDFTTSTAAGSTWVIQQPYVYIHFRLEAGFDRVRFHRSPNGGFEMDNMSVSTEVPPIGDNEVASTVTFELDATDLILADPRDSSVEFNGVSLTGTAFGTTAAANLVTQATICVAVISGASSTDLVDSPRFNLVAASASLTVSRTTNRARWSLSGPKAAVAAASQTITLQTTDSDALVTSGNSMWLRVGVMNGAVTPAQCASSQSNNTLQIRGLTLTASRRVDLDIEN